MAMYEPLRESFRELNRLLVDRQQFNAQQTAREGQDRREDQALASRLENQAFQQVMAEKRLMMQEEMNEETIADRQRTHDLALQKFEHNKEQDEFQRDIDEQVNDRAEEIHNMNHEKRRAEQESAIAELDDLIDAKTQRPAQKTLEGLGIFENPSISENPEALKELGHLLYGEEAKWDEENQEFQKVGDQTTLTLSKNDVNQIFPALLGFKARHSDTEVNVRKKVGQLNNEIQSAEEVWKGANAKAKHDVRFQRTSAAAQAELERLKGERQKQLSMLTPDKRMDRLYQKADDLNKSIAYATSIGAKELAIKLDKDLRNVNSRIEAGEEAMAKGEKDAPTQQRFAVRLDADGNIMETRLLNTVKTLGGSMLPSTFDPKLGKEDGWVWGSQLDAAKKLGFGSQDKRWMDGYRVIQDMYGTKNTYTGNWEMEKGKRDEFQAVQKIYTGLLKEDNKLMAGEAANMASQAFQEIMELHSAEVQAALQDYALAKTVEEKEEMATVLKALNEDAKAELDYAPLEGLIEQEMAKADEMPWWKFGK